MRRSFESHLNEIPKTTPDEKEAGVQIGDFFSDSSSFRRLSGPQQKRIIDLQNQKYSLVERMHMHLRDIDQDIQVEIPAKRTFTVKVLQDGKMYASDKNGDVYPITKGELFTDGAWGTSYLLSPEINRAIRKEYILSETRRSVSEMLNIQIAIVEAALNTDEKERTSYQAVLARMNSSHDVLQWEDGHIAEQMVYSLLKKWILDYDLPISIVAADLYEDVTNKLDFILHLKKESIGVEVEATSQEVGVGIQFTLMHRKDAVVSKRKTIDEVLHRGLQSEHQVENIVLVNMHPSYVRRAINSWKTTKRPGGPDGKLELSAKIDLFDKILTNVMSAEDIRKWKIVIFGQSGDSLKKLRTYS